MKHELWNEAEAVWNMDGVQGGENCPIRMRTEGSVEFVTLSSDELLLSERSLGDGKAVVLKNGFLRMDQHQAVRYRPENDRVSLYIRAKYDKDRPGCFFYSDFLSLCYYGGGIFCAYLGVKTKNGAAYREMPLCKELESGWKDMILTVGNRIVRFYMNGVLRGAFPIEEDLCSPFRDDLMIGAFRCCKPDTYSNCAPFAFFTEMTIDTAALWHKTLSEEEICLLSGVSGCTAAEKDDFSEICRLHNEYFDASAAEDMPRCRELWERITAITSRDPWRPKWHLTQPFGFIYDPCGAFYHNGKYHIYSYHNISYLLNYSSLDHYASDDLFHWYGMPISPLADTENDVYCIYLLNHFTDEEGNVCTLYTGQGLDGKCGILARTDDDLNVYRDKHAVLKKYHHDGHVFRHGDRWYTITSKLCLETREGNLGDPVMMWSSSDLENWREEGEIFCQKKDRRNPNGFMEFPYLLNFGDRDVLILGPHAEYRIGKFDWDTLKFTTDQEEGILLDNTNSFHCFNPLCVDNKGENGAERRIVMALCIDTNGGHHSVPWSCCHVQPRILSLENGHLRQDPLPELEALRGVSFRENDIRLENGQTVESTLCGDSLEINAVITLPEHGRAGIRITSPEGEADTVTVTYCREDDTFLLEGSCKAAGSEKYRAYANGLREVGIRIFTDKRLLEVCVNGQWATTVFKSAADLPRRPVLFTEDSSCLCHKFSVWEMRRSI